jgi:hypothetical protein
VGIFKRSGDLRGENLREESITKIESLVGKASSSEDQVLNDEKMPSQLGNNDIKEL